MNELYARRDTRALGKRFTDHVWAMTTEQLDSKSHIAAELAWRDWVIECEQDARRRLSADYAALTARVAELQAALKRYSWHGGGEVMCERVKGSAYPCTCGLEKILTGFADGAVQK